MKLHHFAHSSASFRVRIALALKGLDVTFVTVNMPSGEQQGEAYARLNPQRLVPCLELDDGRVLGQSTAIIDYLDRIAPNPPLYPDDPVEAAQAAALCQLIAADTTPLQAKVIQRYLATSYQLSEDQVHQWVTHWIRRGLVPIEQFLDQRSPKSPFAIGDNPGIVDIYIVPQLRNAMRFGVDITDLTQLLALNDTCLAHPAFQAAHPDRWAA